MHPMHHFLELLEKQGGMGDWAQPRGFQGNS